MTSLMRWEPFTEDLPSVRMIDRMLGDWPSFLSRSNGEHDFVQFPMDVAETAEGFELSASLPGLEPEHVEIQVHGSTVTLKGQFEAEDEEKGKTYLRRERRRGSFLRSVTLPMDLNADAARATFEHGLLKLYLPKSEAMKPKSVKVSANGN